MYIVDPDSISVGYTVSGLQLGKLGSRGLPEVTHLLAREWEAKPTAFGLQGRQASFPHHCFAEASLAALGS